jgi:hypothetical protein
LPPSQRVEIRRRDDLIWAKMPDGTAYYVAGSPEGGSYWSVWLITDSNWKSSSDRDVQMTGSN